MHLNPFVPSSVSKELVTHISPLHWRLLQHAPQLPEQLYELTHPRMPGAGMEVLRVGRAPALMPLPLMWSHFLVLYQAETALIDRAAWSGTREWETSSVTTSPSTLCQRVLQADSGCLWALSTASPSTLPGTQLSARPRAGDSHHRHHSVGPIETSPHNSSAFQSGGNPTLQMGVELKELKQANLTWSG